MSGSSLVFFENIVNLEKKYILSISPGTIYDRFYLNKDPNMLSVPADTSHYSVGFLSNKSIQKKMVLFRTGPDQDLIYGLSVTQVPQILQISKIFPIPGAAAFVLGVTEWRGIVVPVIDISFIMGEKKPEVGAAGRFLIVRLTSSHSYIALPIFSQIAIHHLPLDDKITRKEDCDEVSTMYEQFDYMDKTLVVPNIDELISCHS